MAVAVGLPPPVGAAKSERLSTNVASPPDSASATAGTVFDADRLSTQDHSRTAAGFTYVYPVLSRRSEGLSIGINLNPNNACNWRCLYCQVPDLKRGSAPEIDLPLLEAELNKLLDQVLADCEEQDAAQCQPVSSPQLRDLAISGNGEPTSCRQLAAVIELVARVLTVRQLKDQLQLIIITNGSLVHQPRVQDCLRRWGQLGGLIWYKVDAATAHGLALRNGARTVPERVLGNLLVAARLCTTWVQTCVFSLDGAAPSAADKNAYISLLEAALHATSPLAGVLLYGLARPSMQPDAQRLAPVPRAWLEEFAAAIRALGLVVKVTP